MSEPQMLSVVAQLLEYPQTAIVSRLAATAA